MKSDLHIQLYDNFREIGYDTQTKATVTIYIALLFSYFWVVATSNTFTIYPFLVSLFIFISSIIIQGKSYRRFTADSIGELVINEDCIIFNKTIVPWSQFRIEDMEIAHYRGENIRSLSSFLFFSDSDMFKAAKSNGINRNKIRLKVIDNTFESNYLIESMEHLEQIKNYITLLTAKKVISKELALKILRNNFHYKYSDFQRFHTDVASRAN